MPVSSSVSEHFYKISETEENNMSKKDFYIKINGELINVSEEVYLTYYRMESRARYLDKKDVRNGKILFSNLDTDEMAGEDGLPDLDSESVEDAAIRSVMVDKLYECMNLLSEYERELLIEIYFHEKSEVQLAKELGVLQQTISYKKLKILKKLQKMFK